jgi:DNA-binding GntR family transcriptional regulator
MSSGVEISDLTRYRTPAAATAASRERMTALEPIQNRYLRDQAFLRLRDAIVSGSLEPGAPLVISEVAASFQLSSMPVREAFKRLVAEGLVEELPRRAHRVAPLTPATALEVLEIVGTLMIRAYELGVPRLDESDVRSLRAAFDDACGRADAGDLTGVLACVHRLHGVVYAATGNGEFERTIAKIEPRFDRVVYLWYTDSLTDVATSYRRDLVELLEAGRRDEAIELMRRAWDRFREVISRREDVTR